MNLLTIRAAAKKIGYSKKTLENWIFHGRLPFSHLRTATGRIRIREADVDQWINETMTVVLPGESSKPSAGDHSPKERQQAKP